MAQVTPMRVLFPGRCGACMLPETELRALMEMRERHGRLRKNTARRCGISRYIWYRHVHGKCHGRFAYWRPDEFIRRQLQGQRNRARYWQSGVSGNLAGRPRRAKDRRPRRKPSGIKATIIAERQERAARLEAARQAEIAEREARLERSTPPCKAFF